MSAIHHKLEIDLPGQPPVQSQGASGTDQGAPSPGSVDPLLLAFYYLLEASNTSDRSAMIHAKQLNQNAQSQQKLNAQLSALRRDSVPSLQSKHYTDYHWHHYHPGWSFTKLSQPHTNPHYRIYLPWEYLACTTRVTHPNQNAVDQAQAVNQELSVQRQMLSDKMTVLQQNAQVKESQVNSISDEAMQTSQEGSHLIQILQSLTFQALLRHAPQG